MVFILKIGCFSLLIYPLNFTIWKTEYNRCRILFLYKVPFYMEYTSYILFLNREGFVNKLTIRVGT